MLNTAVIQVYSPTNNADGEEKDDFYNFLQTTVNSIPKQDILMIIGDLNVKVGKDRTGREREMGPNGIGEMNENGEIFADVCAVNSLVIGDPKIVQDYHILLQNKFSVLENLHDDETSINTAWEIIRDSIVQACEETVGYLQQNRKQWMSENTWKIVNERRQVKEKVLTAITRQQKKQTQEQYNNKDKEVKKSCKQVKRNFVEQLAKEAEAACNKGDTPKPYTTLHSH
ncbi:uncharacterized protein [Mytilus edulis]|uniref:uncharacterized protein n=1 Tax=Mytilus edulis TaxID=6550 RepID=UPI0039EEE979